MTKEEQAKLGRLEDKLDRLIRDTAKSCGSTETSLDNIKGRLDRMETNISFIGEAHQVNGKSIAKAGADIDAIKQRCSERGRALESLQRQVRRRDHSDEVSTPAAAAGFMTDVTPAPVDLPLQPPEKKALLERVGIGAGALVQVLVLLTMVGAMVFWAFKTHYVIQETQAAVRRFTDAGQPQ